MNKENCALKLVDEIILHPSCMVGCWIHMQLELVGIHNGEEVFSVE